MEIQDKNLQPDGQEHGGAACGAGNENPMIKKRWFGRGIYGSKDVPIRLLDSFIGVVIVVIIGMIVYFAIHGGFYVNFDSRGGSEISSVKLRHGSLVAEPETPVRAGYVFDGWFLESNEEAAWNFAVDKVENDLTLVAKWSPAKIMVKLDLNGGLLGGRSQTDPLTVTFGEPYGELPIPSKEGAVFNGWYYSGNKITADSQVLTSGEHVLTADWK